MSARHPRRPVARCASCSLFVALLALLGALAGCRSTPAAHVSPVAAEASAAHARAQAWMRSTEADAHRRAREEALRALELAPDWVAPQRLLDDLAREELRGVEALAAHRAALVQAPGDARELYLAGRLMGNDGAELFERAARRAPELAWAQHGLAWAASARGEKGEAIRYAERALLRARDPWERSYFTSALARFLYADKQRERALALLEQRAAQAEVGASERVWLRYESVRLGLDASAPRARHEAYERALDLLREGQLSEDEVEALAGRMQIVALFEDPDALSLQVALAVRSSPARDELRASLMLAHGPTPLALGLLQRALVARGERGPAGSLMRAARFAAGDFRGAVERWLAELPTQVLTDARLPRDARLARVVECARALDSGAAATERLYELGAALIDAGWFHEARSLAARLASDDLERALELDARGLAGLELVTSVVELVERNGRGGNGGTPPLPRPDERANDAARREREARATGAPGARPSSDTPGVTPRPDTQAAPRASDDAPSRNIDVSEWSLGSKTSGTTRAGTLDLRGLLASMGPAFARAHVLLGGATDAKQQALELSNSPRMSYGPVGEVVHPGPWFSKTDQRAGSGELGAEVPGLAAEMARLGRFALFGELAGGRGPDGTILPRVWVEPRSGEHLGVHWSGTVAWCEGAELRSRAGRSGASISAAALHEGYWVDIDAVRGELAAWNALRRTFSGADGAQRVERVLQGNGLALRAAMDDPTESRKERRRISALLGEAQRVRLAVLRERALHASNGADGADALGEIDLDELVRVTATHEEGHLCDRTRFLPVSHHLPQLLLFLLDCGFSPTRVGQELEYRAQLVGLCDAADARMPLAQILEAAEQGPSSITPHAAGYARLLDDLIAVFDAELARTPLEYPTIDARATLVHQMHRLSSEQVRELARLLAHKKRLSR